MRRGYQRRGLRGENMVGGEREMVEGGFMIHDICYADGFWKDWATCDGQPVFSTLIDKL